MGKLSRDKGVRWELEIAKRLRTIFGDSVKRGFQWRGAEQPDVECPAFWIEAKHHRRVNIRKSFEQALGDATADESKRTPVLVCKDDNKRPLVVMDFEDWLELIRSWYELSSG